MADNIVELRPGVLGDGAHIDPDQILENNKAEFVRLVLVGERADSSIAVAGSDGAAESLLLLQFGSHFIVTNRVER